MKIRPRYLFLKRDGGEPAYHVGIEPTSTDRLCVRLGLLEIIRLDDLARFHPERGWEQVEAGVLSNFSDPSDLADEPAWTHIHPAMRHKPPRKVFPVHCLRA